MATHDLKLTVTRGLHWGGFVEFAQGSVFSIGNDASDDVVLSDLDSEGEALRVSVKKSGALDFFCRASTVIVNDEKTIVRGERACVDLPCKVSIGADVEIEFEGARAAPKKRRDGGLLRVSNRRVILLLASVLLFTSLGAAKDIPLKDTGERVPQPLPQLQPQTEMAAYANPQDHLLDLLKGKLTESGLGGVQLERRENVVFASGALTPTEREAWRMIPPWFDVVGGQDHILLGEFSDLYEESDLPMQPKSVWARSPIHITDAQGNKVGLGEQTSDGWTLVEVTNCCLVLNKRDRLVEVALD